MANNIKNNIYDKNISIDENLIKINKHYNKGLIENFFTEEVHSKLNGPKLLEKSETLVHKNKFQLVDTNTYEYQSQIYKYRAKKIELIFEYGWDVIHDSNNYQY